MPRQISNSPSATGRGQVSGEGSLAGALEWRPGHRLPQRAKVNEIPAWPWIVISSRPPCRAKHSPPLVCVLLPRAVSPLAAPMRSVTVGACVTDRSGREVAADRREQTSACGFGDVRRDQEARPSRGTDSDSEGSCTQGSASDDEVQLGEAPTAVLAILRGKRWIRDVAVGMAGARVGHASRCWS
jgi:hypothetical protein